MVIEASRARAEGVPLFVEELTKVVLESGILRSGATGGGPGGGMPRGAGSRPRQAAAPVELTDAEAGPVLIDRRAGERVRGSSEPDLQLEEAAAGRRGECV
jgi:hypothetical protein